MSTRSLTDFDFEAFGKAVAGLPDRPGPITKLVKPASVPSEFFEAAFPGVEIVDDAPLPESPEMVVSLAVTRTQLNAEVLKAGAFNDRAVAAQVRRYWERRMSDALKGIASACPTSPRT